MTGDLVSVGMPVRNGGATLARALDSILGQTYANLEVVLSDNGSTDGTADIARRYAEQDPRIRYVRPPRSLTAWENYRFVLERAAGEYFLWAADDDVRSPDYVGTLVAALSGSPGAVLAVTDVVRFAAGSEPGSGTTVESSACLHPPSDSVLLRRVILGNCSDFYGLYRADVLRDFPWMTFDYGHDHVLLFYVGLRGDVIRVPGPLFFESIRPSSQVRRQRVKEGFYHRMGRFRMVRFSFHMARVGRAASPRIGRPVNPLRVFAYSYVLLRSTLTKVYVYEHAPEQAVRLWRRTKPSRPEPEPAG